MEATAPTEAATNPAADADHFTAEPQDGRSLNSKQSRFVSEYLKDGNASAAARRAGYTGDNMDVIGPRMLRKAHIAAAIKTIQDVRDAETGFHLAMFTETLAHVALFDPLDLHDAASGRMRPLEQISLGTRLALHLTYKIDPKDPYGKPLLTSASTRDRLRALATLIKIHSPPKPTYADQRRDKAEAEEAAADAERARRSAAIKEALRREEEEIANWEDDPTVLHCCANPDPRVPWRDEARINYARVSKMYGKAPGTLADGVYRIPQALLDKEKEEAEGKAAAAAARSAPVSTANNPSSLLSGTVRSASPQQAADADRMVPDKRPSGAAPVATGNGAGRVGTTPDSKRGAPPAENPNQQKIPTNTNQHPIASLSSSHPKIPAAPPARNPDHPHAEGSGLESLLKALGQTDPALIQKAAAQTRHFKNSSLAPDRSPRR